MRFDEISVTLDVNKDFLGIEFYNDLKKINDVFAKSFGDACTVAIAKEKVDCQYIGFLEMLEIAIQKCGGIEIEIETINSLSEILK